MRKQFKFCRAAVVALLMLSLIRSADGTGVFSFYAIFGQLCIKPEFVQTLAGIDSMMVCAAQCTSHPGCPAFTMADGPCQLFVFDKCSKSVRDCSCSRRGQVFVKEQPGLQPGALCPTGYGDDLCGVKYKLLTDADYWWPSRRRCEAESGLVIMADVVDAAEMTHVESLWSAQAGGKSIWLGGFQPAGSVESRGGWYWVGCNITLDDSLWNVNEPDNSGDRENVVGRYFSRDRLADFWESVETFKVLCECTSPFD